MAPDGNDVQVDARFLLANERTLLAWLRTSLALLAGSVGVFQFGDRLPADVTISVLLVLLGGGTAALGARRYVSADASIRAGRLPERGHAPLLLAVAILLLSVGLLAAVLAHVLS